MSEAAASRLDSLKWAVVLVLVAGGIFGNSYYGDQPILYRVLALLVLALLAVVCVILSFGLVQP